MAAAREDLTPPSGPKASELGLPLTPCCWCPQIRGGLPSWARDQPCGLLLPSITAAMKSSPAPAGGSRCLGRAHALLWHWELVSKAKEERRPQEPCKTNQTPSMCDFSSQALSVGGNA